MLPIGLFESRIMYSTGKTKAIKNTKIKEVKLFV